MTREEVDRIAALPDASDVLDEIHDLMSGKEWGPDTLDAIADVLRRAGFTIEEPWEG